MSAAPRAAAVGLALVALAAGGFAVWWSSRTVEPALVHPSIEPAAWDAYVKRVQDGPEPPPNLAAPVLQAFADVNRAEAAAQGDPAEDLRYLKAAQAMREAAWHLYELRSADEYLQLGRRQAFRLSDAAARLLAHCEGQPLEACLAAGGPAVVDYVDVGGRFVGHASRMGLVVDGRLVDARIPLLQAVFLQHWMAWVRHRADPSGFLWPAERAWWLRFKVELQTTAPVDERVAAADELRAFGDYPVDLNAGVLLYEAGRFADAARRFQRSPLPQAEAYRRAAARRAP